MKKFILVLLIIVILLIGCSLYWFGWRPEQIRKECFIDAQAKAEIQIKKSFGTEFYNAASALGGEALIEEVLGPIYDSCLRKKGINK